MNFIDNSELDCFYCICALQGILLVELSALTSSAFVSHNLCIAFVIFLSLALHKRNTNLNLLDQQQVSASRTEREGGRERGSERVGESVCCTIRGRDLGKLVV